jgi:hypothetical protein
MQLISRWKQSDKRRAKNTSKVKAMRTMKKMIMASIINITMEDINMRVIITVIR